MPVYTAYDDEEDALTTFTPGSQALQSSKRILAQYNEEEKKGPKLVLKGDEPVLHAPVKKMAQQTKVCGCMRAASRGVAGAWPSLLFRCAYDCAGS